MAFVVLLVCNEAVHVLHPQGVGAVASGGGIDLQERARRRPGAQLRRR
jgi:hypothetical protein